MAGSRQYAGGAYTYFTGGTDSMSAAWSWLAIMRFDSVAGNQTWLYQELGPGFGWFLGMDDGDAYVSRAGSGASNLLFPSQHQIAVGEWYLIAITKATGTVRPRFHRVRLSDGAAVHVDFPNTMANYAAPAHSLVVGSYPAAPSYSFAGQIAATGLVAGGAVADGDIDLLATLGWDTWTGAGFTALWRLDGDPPFTDFGEGGDWSYWDDTAVHSALEPPDFWPPPPGYADLILDEPALLGYWRLDDPVLSAQALEARGGTSLAAVSSGGGVAFGLPALISGGGTAAEIADQAVLSGSVASANALKAVELWVEPGDGWPVAGSYVASIRGTGQFGGFIGMGVRTATGGLLQLVGNNGAAGPTWQPPASALHLALFHDGTTLWLYANDEQVASMVTSPPNTPNGVQALWVGGGAGQLGTIVVDEVAVYSSLDAARVAAHYEAGAPSARIEYRTLVAGMVATATSALGASKAVHVGVALATPFLCRARKALDAALVGAAGLARRGAKRAQAGMGLTTSASRAARKRLTVTTAPSASSRRRPALALRVAAVLGAALDATKARIITRLLAVTAGLDGSGRRSVGKSARVTQALGASGRRSVDKTVDVVIAGVAGQAKAVARTLLVAAPVRAARRAAVARRVVVPLRGGAALWRRARLPLGAGLRTAATGRRTAAKTIAVAAALAATRRVRASKALTATTGWRAAARRATTKAIGALLGVTPLYRRRIPRTMVAGVGLASDMRAASRLRLALVAAALVGATLRRRAAKRMGTTLGALASLRRRFATRRAARLHGTSAAVSGPRGISGAHARPSGTTTPDDRPSGTST